MIEHYQDKGDFEESGLAAIIPGYFGFRTTQWKYIEYDTGERELYNLFTDPFEMNNLAGELEYEEIISSLQSRLYEVKGP